MSEFLGYLQRLKVRPAPDDLTNAEINHLQQHFDAYAAEVVVDGQVLDWDRIDEVEVVKAARIPGPAGWLTRQLMTDDRYHVGIYHARQEAVLPNVSLRMAAYIVQTIAFYAPRPVRYSGIEGVSPIVSA